MISLHAVDLAVVNEAWERRTLDALIAAWPRGRVACVLSGPVGGVVVDGRRPPAHALLAVPAAHRRNVFEALVEDHAAASLHDVPEEGLNAALAVIARISGKHELSLDRLQKKASPASPEGGLACALWRVEPSSLAAARRVVDDPSLRDADLPEARVAGVDRGHIHDVIEALGQILSALERAGTSLVVLGSR